MPTYGLPTSKRGFRLSDGANLVLTVGTSADRNGTPHWGSIAPDEIVPGHWDRPSGEGTLDAALTWLLAHPACQN